MVRVRAWTRADHGRGDARLPHELAVGDRHHPHGHLRHRLWRWHGAPQAHLGAVRRMIARRLVGPMIFIVAVFVAWEAWVRIGDVRPIVAPSPLSVLDDY